MSESSSNSKGLRTLKPHQSFLFNNKGGSHSRTLGGSTVQNSSARDVGSIPGSGRFPAEGNGNPLQYSHLGNPKDRETWQVTIRGAMKEPDRTQQLNNNKHGIVLNFSNTTAKIRKTAIYLLSMWALEPNPLGLNPGPDTIQLYELGPQCPGL